MLDDAAAAARKFLPQLRHPQVRRAMHPPFIQAGIPPVILLPSQGQEDEEHYGPMKRGRH